VAELLTVLPRIQLRRIVGKQLRERVDLFTLVARDQNLAITRMIIHSDGVAVTSHPRRSGKETDPPGERI